MKITIAKNEDAGKISKLRINSIKKNLSKEYSKEIVSWLTKENGLGKTLELIKNEKIFCLWDSKELIGTITFLENSKRNHHMGGLYIKSNKLGKGYGTKLLNYFEKFAKNKGIKKIKINSTNYAYNYYKSKGYVHLETHMAWKELGTPTKVYEMEKKLKKG